MIDRYSLFFNEIADLLDKHKVTLSANKENNGVNFNFYKDPSKSPLDRDPKEFNVGNGTDFISVNQVRNGAIRNKK